MNDIVDECVDGEREKFECNGVIGKLRQGRGLNSGFMRDRFPVGERHL